MTETRVRYPVHGDASLDPPATKMTLLHQMRPWPPMWRRPVKDRPPYAVWVIASLVAWAFILAGFMAWDLNSPSRTVVWFIFLGWCIGVLSASIARKIYR
jgi:hypothetical protein